MRPFAGEDASGQPADIPDVLLHETAVAWVKARRVKTTPPRAWEESRAAFAERVRAAAAYVNSQYDVEGLCMGFVERLKDVVARKGDRLSK